MRKIAALALAVFLALSLGFSGGGNLAATDVASATTSVNHFIDVSHIGTINFGSVNPGSNYNPNTTSFHLVLENTTNVDTNLSLKADAYFIGSTPQTSVYNFSTANMSYSSNSSSAGSVRFTTNYTTESLRTALGWTSIKAPTTLGQARLIPVWFWIDIPTGQYAATYNATITLRISEFQ